MSLFLSKSPKKLNWWVAKGYEYEQLSSYRIAEWIFRYIVKNTYNSTTAYYDLGRILLKRGKLQEAKTNFAYSLQLKSDFYLCRIGFFETCRQEYWTYHPILLQNIQKQISESSLTYELQYRRLHLLFSAGVFQLMRLELARLDYDDLDTSVYDRIKVSLEDVNTFKIISRLFKRQYKPQFQETAQMFESLEQALNDFNDLNTYSSGRKATVCLRKKGVVEISGFRDSDDLIGYHLEIISGGRLSFLNMDCINKLELGIFSEFTETSLYLNDGTHMHVVVPSIYFGSQYSSIPELKRGEFSILKDLYHGINIGIGRRVFSGKCAKTGTQLAFGINEIQSIEF